MTAMIEPLALSHDDAPHPSGDDRYALYAIGVLRNERRRLCETSLDGIGVALVALREDGDITDDTRIGIFDRQERTWLVNPWAKGVL